MSSHDAQLVNLHMSRTMTNNICLLFHCKYDYPVRNQLYFVEFSHQNEGARVRKFYPPFCASMPKFNVVGSCNGLLCIADSLYSDAVYIYNPFISNCKQLPTSKHSQQGETILGFGFHPMINEYKVVKMVYPKNAFNWRRPTLGFSPLLSSQSEIHVFTLGSKTWRSIGKILYALEHRSSSEAPLVNGRLHWLTQPVSFDVRKIISFDLADEKFQELSIPDCAGSRHRNYALAVLGRSLALVVYCSNGDSEIWVMKEYNEKGPWLKELKIGAYSPIFQNPHSERSFGLRPARVICLLKDGEVLIEYEGGTLVSYNPKSRNFKNLVFWRMPTLFRTIPHTASLNWIETPIEV
ncbi:hypothetical protein RJ639_011238 [Escallonia herrerae]|uniref:F-box associated beta-propeller type 3 domain-containing protein n=1 Tax=Escallonia herrerae TaxID=1293975 RepID=A0AA88VN59_9ASTE|nr:hypothetical protein RJ639_011238 [Escallonia herrerae]